MLRRSLKEVFDRIPLNITISNPCREVLIDMIIQQSVLMEKRCIASHTTSKLISLRDTTRIASSIPQQRSGTVNHLHNKPPPQQTTFTSTLIPAHWTPQGPLRSSGLARSISIPPSWSGSALQDDDNNNHHQQQQSIHTSAAARIAGNNNNKNNNQHSSYYHTSATTTTPSGKTTINIPPTEVSGPDRRRDREMKAVNTAVFVNGIILVSKLGAWGITSSGALLAEALHSTADIVNQLLLRAGVQQSRRAPTRQHPYGYGREKYVYALMSAVGVFCIGAGASVVHGIQCIFDPPVLEHMGYSMAVLVASATAEFYSLKVAWNAVRSNAKEQGTNVWQFVKRGNDPTTVSVLAEDAGAVAGLAIAGISSYLTWFTHNPLYDAFGSITIGVLMGAIAVGLIKNNKRFLIGQALRPEVEAEIVRHLRADPMVLAVLDPKSEAMADGVYRFTCEIQWDGDRMMSKYLKALGKESMYRQIRSSVCSAESEEDHEVLSNAMDLAMMEVGRGIIRSVGEEIDRLEAELKGLVPGLEYVDLETDRGRAPSETEMSSLACEVGETFDNNNKDKMT